MSFGKIVNRQKDAYAIKTSYDLRWLAMVIVGIGFAIVVPVENIAQEGERSGENRPERQREQRREERRDQVREVADSRPTTNQYDAAKSRLNPNERQSEAAERTENNYDQIPWELKNPKLAEEKQELLNKWVGIEQKIANGERPNRQELQDMARLESIAKDISQYESANSPINAEQNQYDRVQMDGQTAFARRFRQAEAERQRNQAQDGNRRNENRQRIIELQLRERTARLAYERFYQGGQQADFIVSRYAADRRNPVPTREQVFQANYYRQYREQQQRQLQTWAQWQVYGRGAYASQASQIPSQQRQPTYAVRR